MKEALQPIAGSVVHEILVKGSIDKAQGGRVIERVSGNVDTGDLERRPFRPPGSEERGVRLPVAPAILRLPLPLAVPGIDLRHRDVMAQQRADGSVSAGEVQQPRAMPRAAHGTERRMDCLQRPSQRHRHSVTGRPQRGEVGARVIEIVDPGEESRVLGIAIGGIAHSGLGLRREGADQRRARCRHSPFPP